MIGSSNPSYYLKDASPVPYKHSLGLIIFLFSEIHGSAERQYHHRLHETMALHKDYDNIYYESYGQSHSYLIVLNCTDQSCNTMQPFPPSPFSNKMIHFPVSADCIAFKCCHYCPIMASMTHGIITFELDVRIPQENGTITVVYGVVYRKQTLCY